MADLRSSDNGKVGRSKMYTGSGDHLRYRQDGEKEEFKDASLLVVCVTWC